MDRGDRTKERLGHRCHAELIDAADRHSSAITLKAAGRRGAHGIEKLVAYYQRFGFKRLGGPSRVRVMMTRLPQ
jgi:hypothetical protein